MFSRFSFDIRCIKWKTLQGGYTGQAEWFRCARCKIPGFGESDVIQTLALLRAAYLAERGNNELMGKAYPRAACPFYTLSARPDGPHILLKFAQTLTERERVMRTMALR